MPASICLFLILRVAVQFVSGSTIITYTDSDCLDPSLKLTGPNNGLCQQTLSGAGSFKITSLDPGCVGMPFASPGHFPRSKSRLTWISLLVTVFGVGAPIFER